MSERHQVSSGKPAHTLTQKYYVWIRKKKDKIPFVGLNILNETSYEKFEERLNLLFNLNYEDYTKKTEKKHTYLMHNTNTIENLLEFFKKNTDPL